MAAFDLKESMDRAARRLGSGGTRADRGSTRLDPRVVECVEHVLSGQERPTMADMLHRLEVLCRERGLRAPSRATVYKLMSRLPARALRTEDLPLPVREALYNLGPGEVPAHQVAFYCLNYGDIEAMSFAAGLPWLAIYQALRLPGYRPKSRGLIEAIARARGIGDGRA